MAGVRKKRVGLVVSNSMDKSCVVKVMRTVQDPVFKKYVKRHKKYMAHDEENKCNLGDVVEIEECRPLSKRKSWKVIKVVEEALR
ncbi:MAG: 30S ribosomal protein S17 [Pseudomonadota bacterium]